MRKCSEQCTCLSAQTLVSVACYVVGQQLDFSPVLQLMLQKALTFFNAFIIVIIQFCNCQEGYSH